MLLDILQYTPTGLTNTCRCVAPCNLRVPYLQHTARNTYVGEPSTYNSDSSLLVPKRKAVTVNRARKYPKINIHFHGGEGVHENTRTLTPEKQQKIIITKLHAHICLGTGKNSTVFLVAHSLGEGERFPQEQCETIVIRGRSAGYLATCPR